MVARAFGALCAGLSLGLAASASLDDSGSMIQRQPVTGIQPVDVALATLKRAIEEPKSVGRINVTYNRIATEPGASVTFHVSDTCDVVFSEKTPKDGGSCNIRASGFDLSKFALQLKMKEPLTKEDNIRIAVNAYIQSMGLTLPISIECGWCEADCDVKLMGSKVASFTTPACSSATEVRHPLADFTGGSLPVPSGSEGTGDLLSNLAATLTVKLDIIRGDYTPYLKSELTLKVGQKSGEAEVVHKSSADQPRAWTKK